MGDPPGYRYELHCHSEHSPDSRLPVKDILRQAKRAGLAGISITDHNSTGGSDAARQIAPKDLLVIPGIEVSSARGHILGIGVLAIIPKGLPASEVVHRIHESGGVAIAAHPFRVHTGLGARQVRSSGVALVEAVNGRTWEFANRRAAKLAERLRLGRTGGSDAHTLAEIGGAHTILEEQPEDVDSFLALLRKRRCRPGGTGRPLTAAARRAKENVAGWMHRGMRDI